MKNNEQHFCILLAGRVIRINTLFPNTYMLCNGYYCEQIPEMEIKIRKEDVAFERAEAKDKAPKNDGYLETLAVYRKICENMISYDTFLMHGAVIALDQKAYMFTAESGTGKTTHIKKWLNNLKNAFVVNGDKPLIQVTESQVIACGTPWSGKEGMNTNTMTPLKAIVLMERGENNSMEEISFGKAFPILLQQTYRPNEIEQMKKTLKLLMQLNGKVLFYKFIFNNLKEDAFDIAYHTLTRKQYETDKNGSKKLISD